MVYQEDHPNVLKEFNDISPPTPFPSVEKKKKVLSSVVGGKKGEREKWGRGGFNQRCLERMYQDFCPCKPKATMVPVYGASVKRENHKTLSQSGTLFVLCLLFLN